MDKVVDYDRRTARPSNVIFEAEHPHDPTNDRLLHVFHDIEDGLVNVSFVEDTGCASGLDVHDMTWLNAAQCEELGTALLATAAEIRRRA